LGWEREDDGGRVLARSGRRVQGGRLTGWLAADDRGGRRPEKRGGDRNARTKGPSDSHLVVPPDEQQRW
jgi:hypothetical protein